MRIRDLRSKRYFNTHNIIIDAYGKELGPIGLATYMALCRMADQDTQTCYPSYQTLADRIGASRSAVGSKLKLMKRLGLITWTQQPRPDKGNKLSSNIYTLLDPPKRGVEQEVPHPSAGGGLGVGQEVDGNNPHVEQSSPKLPAPTAQGLDELEYVPVEGDGFEEDGRRRPKWQVPETLFQRIFLGVCGAKWFRPRQKTKVKKLSKCLDIGEVLTGADCYERCLEELADCSDFPDRPIAMPVSWYAWRTEHAKVNRWSVDGLIKALFDRDALVRHCQIKLKKLGAPVKLKYQEENMEVCELGTVG